MADKPTRLKLIEKALVPYLTPALLAVAVYLGKLAFGDLSSKITQDLASKTSLAEEASIRSNAIMVEAQTRKSADDRERGWGLELKKTVDEMHDTQLTNFIVLDAGIRELRDEMRKPNNPVSHEN